MLFFHQVSLASLLLLTSASAQTLYGISAAPTQTQGIDYFTISTKLIDISVGGTDAQGGTTYIEVEGADKQVVTVQGIVGTLPATTTTQTFVEGPSGLAATVKVGQALGGEIDESCTWSPDHTGTGECVLKNSQATVTLVGAVAPLATLPLHTKNSAVQIGSGFITGVAGIVVGAAIALV
ncbi:unnamed protein product [Mycena citricolor]|uniref:GPI anchored cell wall protein n=1 Tax=Mycena citricolor TaxID=2018698 RepID=A0AAD2H205_9AGAR|nr:unnamed protein product [Mycena citricolor]